MVVLFLFFRSIGGDGVKGRRCDRHCSENIQLISVPAFLNDATEINSDTAFAVRTEALAFALIVWYKLQQAACYNVADSLLQFLKVVFLFVCLFSFGLEVE